MSACVHNLKEPTVYTVCARLSYHAGSAPDVCGGAVTSPDQDFNGAVLPGLDVLCKVLVLCEREKRSQMKFNLFFPLENALKPCIHLTG